MKPDKPIMQPTLPDTMIEVSPQSIKEHGLKPAIVKTLANEGFSQSEIYERMHGVISKSTINRHYPKDDAPLSGYLYLLEGVFGWYKIGYTQNPDKRISDLNILLPFPVKILHLIPTNNMRSAEKILHDRYTTKRGNGEWFELDRNDISDICKIDSLMIEV